MESVRKYLHLIKGKVLIGLIIFLLIAVAYFYGKSNNSVLGISNSQDSTPSPTVTQLSTPAQTVTPTPTATPDPIVIYKEPTSASTPYPTQTPIPAVIQTTTTKLDSATHIELCKTKAETFKTQTMTALVLVYNQNNADAMRIANTSSVKELVDVGISIGLITREQYNSDPSGHELTLLKLREKVMAEIKSFMDTVNGKGGIAYNDYYAKCLNNEIN